MRTWCGQCGSRRWSGLGGKCRGSVARPPAAPPDRANDQGLVFGLVTAYAATATGARLSFAIVLFSPITVADRRDARKDLTTSRSCFGPSRSARCFALVVDPPGTAPGSCIAASFPSTSIVLSDN